MKTTFLGRTIDIYCVTQSLFGTLINPPTICTAPLVYAAATGGSMFIYNLANI